MRKSCSFGRSMCDGSPFRDGKHSDLKRGLDGDTSACMDGGNRLRSPLVLHNDWSASYPTTISSCAGSCQHLSLKGTTLQQYRSSLAD